MTTENNSTQAEIVLPSSDLSVDMEYFEQIGFRLDSIHPDDDPAVAKLSGHGMHIRLDKDAPHSPVTIHILTDQPEKLADGKAKFTAPNGTHFKVFPKTYQVIYPPTQHGFEVRQLADNDPWVIGRAGMQYRDLVPTRLGGSIMASHIRIPNGGPVPDMVHYHTIGFQLIFCYKGWVKLVYEDQGPQFILKAGDCVTQPPEIRHRVLEASNNLEVIEIGVPAEHLTTIDHEMELPTATYAPEREFQGQYFCHHIMKDAIWKPWKINGFEYRDTGIAVATNGVAEVHVARSLPGVVEQELNRHKADILFVFVMDGEMELHATGQEPKQLHSGDAFVMPPELPYKFAAYSPNLELLEVALK